MLRELGWPQATVASAPGAEVRFEAENVAFTMGGLDWSIVVGQDIMCADNEVWRFGSCGRCAAKQVPASDRACAPCNATQRPDAEQRRCSCPVGTYASDQKHKGIRCDECTNLYHKIEGAEPSPWRDVRWDSEHVCPGSNISHTAICPVEGLWIHQSRQPADAVALYPCPACINANCSAAGASPYLSLIHI